MINLVHTKPYFEAMGEETIALITYSNDVSSMNEVGSYVVQSLALNGVQRCLPTFRIFTESRPKRSGDVYTESYICFMLSLIFRKIDTTMYKICHD